MTPEETHVWRYFQELNARLPDGVFWCRQICVGRYIVDFICPKAKLVLEIDGSSHIGKEHYDHVRQLFIERAGYEVLRLTNVDTYNEDILLRFMEALEKKTLHRLTL
jgi:very-short-patch-repair endonuclease